MLLIATVENVTNSFCKPTPTCSVNKAVQCTDKLTVQVAAIKNYKAPRDEEDKDDDNDDDDDKKKRKSPPPPPPPQQKYCRVQKPSKNNDENNNGRPKRSLSKNYQPNNCRYSCQKPEKVCETYDFKWGIIC